MTGQFMSMNTDRFLEAAASLSQETDRLLRADVRGAQSVHWEHVGNCQPGYDGNCTCSHKLFTRQHLENYTGRLQTLEIDQASGASPRTDNRPRVNKEALAVTSEFFGTTTGGKADQQKVRSDASADNPKFQQTAHAMFSSTSVRPSGPDRGFWGTGCFEFTFRRAFAALQGWQRLFNDIHPPEI